MSPRFPVFIDLSGQHCVVVGGGEVGTRRVQSLLNCGARVRVISLGFSEALVAWAAAQGEDMQALELVERTFRESDLTGARLVLACTDDAKVNAQIIQCARSQQILCNRCDAPDESDFYFPGLVTRGELSIGINTNGGSPSVTKQVRELVEMMLPDDFGERISQVGRTGGDA